MPDLGTLEESVKETTGIIRKYNSLGKQLRNALRNYGSTHRFSEINDMLDLQKIAVTTKKTRTESSMHFKTLTMASSKVKLTAMETLCGSTRKEVKSTEKSSSTLIKIKRINTEAMVRPVKLKEWPLKLT